MADNWALVVGVNDYKTAGHALKGAVRDAVQFADWLVRVGEVKPRNLFLHLSGAAPGPIPVKAAAAADRSSIIDGMEQLLTRSGGKGDRFFFYFAGHGLSSGMNAELQSAVLPSDFRAAETDRSFTVSSLFGLLASTEFAEQYFFIDACRNIPFDTSAVLGRYPLPRTARTPPFPQFVMFATQPGVKAAEIQQPNDEHGAFTNVLLEGLAGAGAAKVWNDDIGDYGIRWDSLFRYVENQVRNRKLAVGANAAGAVIQVPQQYGERGGENPLLASLPESAVTRQRLLVSVTPSGALPHAKLLVTDFSGVVESVPPPLEVPQPLDLLPRTYGLITEAAGYRRRLRVTKVDLYEPCAVDIGLLPQMATAPEPEAHVVPGIDGGQHLVFHVATRGLSTRAGAGVTGRIRIRASDPLAWVELASSAGVPLGSSRGSLTKADLKEGFYRASLLAPDGSRSEQLIQAVANETADVLLAPNVEAVSAPLSWALTRGGFAVDQSGVVQPSEAVGPSYFLKLSTLLALAAGASNDSNQTYGAKLRQLGIPGLDVLAGPRGPAPSGGLYLVVGDECNAPSASGALWQGARMVCAPAGASPEDPRFHKALTVHPGEAAIAYSAMRSSPGPHGLRLELPGNLTMTVPVSVMPDWLGLMVVTREANRTFEVHHYQMPLRDMPELQTHRPEAHAFAALRRIEIMQRMVQAGRLSPAKPEVDMLLWDKWRDPIAGCLGAYLLLRSGRHADLGVPARNLALHFPWVPDGHVLLAMVEQHKRNFPAAERHLLEAAGRGLPVFRDGLVAMVEAAGRLKLDAVKTLAAGWLTHVPEGSLFSLATASHAAP